MPGSAFEPFPSHSWGDPGHHLAMAADFHTHTDASDDSPLSFDERIALAVEHDLETIAITDHTAVHERLTAREEAVDGVTVIAGVELASTVEGTRIDVLGYFIEPNAMREWIEERNARDEGRPAAADAIDRIHRTGGAAVLAHPGRYDVDLSLVVETLVDAGLDGIEIEYPYDQYTFVSKETPEMPKTPVAEIETIATKHELVETGGSDCHGGDKTYTGLIRIGSDRVDRLRAASEAYR